MAARKQPSKGSKPDKLIRDLLLLELHREVEWADDRGKRHKIQKAQALVRAWVNAAIKGDVHAIDKIVERVDGKVALPIRGPGEGGSFPVDVTNLSGMSDAELSVLERAFSALVAGRGTSQPRSDQD